MEVVPLEIGDVKILKPRKFGDHRGFFSEWISAGDAAFVERAHDRLQDYLLRTGILVLASHDLKVIHGVCNKVAWMERGRIVEIGRAEDVVPAYVRSMTTHQDAPQTA